MQANATTFQPLIDSMKAKSLLDNMEGNSTKTLKRVQAKSPLDNMEGNSTEPFIRVHNINKNLLQCAFVMQDMRVMLVYKGRPPIICLLENELYFASLKNHPVCNCRCRHRTQAVPNDGLIQQLTRKTQKLEQDIANLQLELAASKAANQTQAVHNVSHDSSIPISTLMLDIANLQLELAASKAANQTQAMHNVSHDSSILISTLMQQKEQLTQEKEQLRETHGAELQQRTQNIAKVTKELDAKLQQLTQENKQLTQDKEQLTQDHDAKLQQLKQEKEELNTQVAVQMTKEVTTETTLVATQQELKDIETQLRTALDNIAAYEEYINRADHRMKQFKELLEELKDMSSEPTLKHKKQTVKNLYKCLLGEENWTDAHDTELVPAMVAGINTECDRILETYKKIE